MIDISRSGSRRFALACAGALAVSALATGCSAGSPPASYSSSYFSTPAAHPTLSSTVVPSRTTTPPQPTGTVSTPNPGITPGDIATTDVNQVCQLPLHIHVHPPKSVVDAIYYDYGVPAPHAGTGNGGYELDYLVPLTLGGAADEQNLWLAATSGIGYTAKQQAAVAVRNLVCQGKVALATVQHQFEVNWYSLWLKYVYDVRA